MSYGSGDRSLFWVFVGIALLCLGVIYFVVVPELRNKFERKSTTIIEIEIKEISPSK